MQISLNEARFIPLEKSQIQAFDSCMHAQKVQPCVILLYI